MMTQRGFTLIEIAVVVAVIGVIAALAAPYLMPAIIFSRLEGAARHAAGYGRSAIAYAVLMREPITVKFDLKKQEYWCEHKVQKEEDFFEEDKEGSPGDTEESGTTTKTDTKTGGHGLFGDKDFSEGMGPSEADIRMMQRFDAFARSQLEVRSKQVKKEGILDEIGPLFEGKKFSLEGDESEQIEEIKDPILERTKLPQGVIIESILKGDASYTSGEVEVELLPAGMVEPVTLYIKGEDDEYYTVTWDPITAGSKLEEGKQTPKDAETL